MRFDDRLDAGRQLAAAVADRVRGEDVVVLGLPRGGVPVAACLAAALHAPLDVLLVRKVGHPRHPEFAIGAVAEGGVEVHDEAAQRRLPRAVVADAVGRARHELRERANRYRGVAPPVPVEGRTVVVVDDGLATGATARSALRAVRARRPARLVLAVPVASPRGLQTVRGAADDVVCLGAPADFRAVGNHYRDFSATTDDEVRALLRRHAGSGPPDHDAAPNHD